MQKFHQVRVLKLGSIRILGVFQLQEVPPTVSCIDEVMKITGVCDVGGQFEFVAPLHPP